MAVRVSTEVTVTDQTDATALVTFYQLTSSATKPAKPTTTDASATPPGWSKAEPSFDPAQGTRWLYTCLQLVWGDGTCTWGDVQASSAYEQAKQAWNAAHAAGDAAQAVADAVGTLAAPCSEVEWVESCGKQYVFLDWHPPIATWGFEADFIIRNAFSTSAGAWNAATNANGYGNVFGVRNASVVNDIQLGSCGANGMLRMGNGTNQLSSGHMATDRTSRQTISLRGTTLTGANGATKTVTRPSETANKPYANMCVFAMHDGLRRSASGSVSQPGTVRIYSLRFYDGDTLAVDLVGAVRRSDGTTGLWDRVSGHFYPAPGMSYGDVVGDLGEAPTVAGLAATSDVRGVVDNLTDRRMWRASVPLDRLEDGQKLTVTPMYTVVKSYQTDELPGWDDTGENTSVYLKLTLVDGTETDWVPCYYMNDTRLTTHYGAGNPVLLTYRENALVGATDTAAGSAVMRGWWADPNYDTNTNDRILHNSRVSADTAISAGRLVCGDADGYHHVAAGATFDLAYPVLYASAAIGAGASASTTYEAYPSVNFSTSGTVGSAARFSTVYLRGAVVGNEFTVSDSSFLTCAAPTSDDGFAYIPIGMLGDSATTGFFSTSSQLWCHKDGAFGPVSIREASAAAKTATNYITADANGITIHMQGNSSTYQRLTSTASTWYVGSAKRSEVSADGLKVYVGSAGSEVEVGSFGATTQIGKSDESHMTLDYHSMRLVDKAGTTYFYISDLRDETGVATITERFFGDGSKTVFTVSLTVSAEVSATVSNDPTNTATRNGSAYVFASAPSVGSEVIIVYKTTSERAKAYTLGRRLSSNIGPYSMAEGLLTDSTALCSHAEGFTTKARGNYAHAEGNTTEATSTSSHAEGDHTEASGMYSHAEGNMTKASEDNAHAEGYHTLASGNGSHAEGFHARATASHAHAEGSTTNATGYSSHAEGGSARSSGDYSHAEGNGTASGHYSHVEGGGSTASGHCSHAEGGRYNVDPNTGMVSTLGNIASGIGSHAEGVLTQAGGEASHAGGYYTEAASDYQTAIGKYNDNDPANAFEIGNGTADDARSNALAVDWSGNLSNAGAITSVGTIASGGAFLAHDGRERFGGTDALIRIYHRDANDAEDFRFDFYVNSNGNPAIRSSFDAGSSWLYPYPNQLASRSANTVWAAPNGSNGAPSFRKLVAADLPTVTTAKGGTGVTATQESTVTGNTSNVTVLSQYNHCWHNGIVCTVTFGFNLKANLASGATLNVGTVPEGWRAPYTVHCAVYGSTAAVGGMQAYLLYTGTITIRNNSGAAVGTSPNIYVTATFALAI